MPRAKPSTWAGPCAFLTDNECGEQGELHAWLSLKEYVVQLLRGCANRPANERRLLASLASTTVATNVANGEWQHAERAG